ncbi:MAG: FtsW/RodA/SpoVE family cell cycle protein [Patescibacteria group bacterium]|nr:FtsW/RodA/SpoVE family cell cycle protein [Patescibacteria group bacterium]
MLWGLDKNLFWRQLLFWLIGVVFFLLLKTISARRVFLPKKRVYLLILLFLALPLLFGRVVRGSSRWLEIGIFSIQPSELVKPFLIGVFASFLANGVSNFKNFLALILLIFLPVFLVLVQPDLGSAAIVLVTLLSLVFIAKPNLVWWLPLIVGLGLILLLAGNRIFEPYQLDRITSFLNPEQDPLGKGYNLIQAKLAIGAGGWSGRGFGLGRQTQLSFLPEKQTDFIFASLAEELGFFGVLFTLWFYLLFFNWLIKKIALSENGFWFFLRSGIFLQIFLQTAINLAMNLQLFPVVGVPLPFLSYGGSSLFSTFLALGLFL